MAIYAYADETIFVANTETNELALGCGIFVTESKIEQSVIDDAILKLSEDNDFDSFKDKRTISRNYFHASEDSKNGHSYLCRAINENIKGVFDYTFINKINLKDTTQKGFSESIFNRCLSHSTIELFLATDEVFLVIENRNEINEATLLNWKKQVYNMYEGTAYNLPTYKTFYPKLNISLKGKSEPGLQVVDFLMWAANRKKTINPDETWHRRLKYNTWFEYEDEGNQNRAKFHLNSTPLDRDVHNDYPVKFKKFEEWEDFLYAYIAIERFLVHIDKSDFTTQSIHLYDDFHNISMKLANDTYHLKSSDYKEIGSTYLRLFDTLPIYRDVKDSDLDSWTILLNSKYLASMLVRNDQIHFNRTKGEIHRWRYKMQTENGEEFKKLIYD